MTTIAPDPTQKCLRIGVSRCLLGDGVRYDGGHKRDAFILNFLAPHAELIAVCPEVEVGMGVPRPTLRLVHAATGPRMIVAGEERDVTDAMNGFAQRRVRELERNALDGFILKSRSPSCGMERVKVYRGAHGMSLKSGVGLFAAALMQHLPLLPVEEEGRLNDPVLRENFIVRVFAHRRVHDLFASRWTVGSLVRFHAAEKLLLMSHSPSGYQELGRLVATAKGAPRAEVAARYGAVHHAALRARATRGRHANVLQHMAGHLRDHLDAGDRAELAELIHDYRKGLVPLVVPITLMRHHARRHDVSYLLQQVYLNPHPREWMLRNHV